MDKTSYAQPVYSSNTTSTATPIATVHVTNAYLAHEPTAPPLTHQSSVFRFQNEGGAREFLIMNGFPTGLQNAFIGSLTKYPMRYFIIDDSGSMGTDDGNRILTASNGKKTMVKCSRWVELGDAMRFHINFSKQALAPSEFRLLNGASPIRIGYPGVDTAQEGANYTALLSMLDESPGGGTPLCRHIREVVESIRLIADELRANGQKACLVIATDGESSDGNIIDAMKPLKDLPVWVVIRLCTNEERIVNYWNEIDDQIEVNMDVIDDLCGEAAEITRNNSWLTYGEPLQRLREFGCSIRELDNLDECKLSKEQFLKVCHVLYGGQLSDYPHPDIDTPGLIRKLEMCNKEGKVWDPILKRDHVWIDISKVKSIYGKKGCTIS